MAATPSIKVMKRGTFKAGTRVWSNRYHFNGGTPADTAHWTTFSDNVVAEEAPIHTPDVTIIETIGYAAGSDVPVFSKTYSTVGTNATVGNRVPGQVAGLLRWSTTARSSKNHPIYLFNYFHNVRDETSAGNQDYWASVQKAAVDEYAADWIAGFSDGTLTLVRAGPNGATATGSFTEEFLTHRDFPYTPSA